MSGVDCWYLSRFRSKQRHSSFLEPSKVSAGTCARQTKKVFQTDRHTDETCLSVCLLVCHCHYLMTFLWMSCGTQLQFIRVGGIWKFQAWLHLIRVDQMEETSKTQSMSQIPSLPSCLVEEVDASPRSSHQTSKTAGSFFSFSALESRTFLWR